MVARRPHVVRVQYVDGTGPACYGAANVPARAKPARATPARTITLDLASRIEMLEVVQTVVSHVVALQALDEEAAHDLDLAVRESVVNAIKHGNRGEPARRVVIAFVLGADAVEVEVKDEGTGFDPDAVPDPLAPENLLRAGGRGIFFMRSFMNEVGYRFPDSGGTVVRMVKRLKR
jgi:serine/threonine-protein kinase RsbW